ncbi:MAG: sensor histidine kinase [Lysobacteraceae bacterium]
MQLQARSLIHPLNLAAYLAWAVIGSGLWLHAPRSTGWLDPSLVWPTAIGLHALFMVFFVSAQLFDMSTRAMTHRVLAQAVVAFAAMLVARDGQLPILMIVVMAQFAGLLSARGTNVAFVAINFALYIVYAIVWNWPLGDALEASLLYASFQAFAALTTYYAASSERSRVALALVNADLLATRSLLTESARDQERLRLSRELHDIAGHKLTALKLNLAALTRTPAANNTESISLCAQLADELLHDLRGVVQQMRLHDGMDLRTAIERLVAPFPQPRVHLSIAGDARVASVEQAEAVLRAVQEALTNTARHASATNIWITLSRNGERIVLDVRDDGRAVVAVSAGNGLRGMRERLEAIGGGLDVDRSDSGGVQLHAWLPATA